jgi:hypothetical protein
MENEPMTYFGNSDICPYPIPIEICPSCEIDARQILTRQSLVAYLSYVFTQETHRQSTAQLYGPNLAQACVYILENRLDVSPETIHTISSSLLETESSKRVLSYSDFDVNRPNAVLINFSPVLVTTGGYLGLNLGHWFTLDKGQEALEAIGGKGTVLLGLERDRYLRWKQEQNSKTSLRPWPLIVTISMYIHCYQNLFIFVMPEIPEGEVDLANEEYEELLEAHHDDLYGVLRGGRKDMYMIINSMDRYCARKLWRMLEAGIFPPAVVFIRQGTLSLSSSILLGNRGTSYRQLISEFPI